MTENEKILLSVLGKSRMKKCFLIPDEAVVNSVIITRGTTIVFTDIGRYFLDGTIDAFIINKEFAKAFFGKERHAHLIEPSNVYGGISFLGGEIEAMEDSDIIFHQEEWKYHLQNMVISEDPIQYLSQFL